jgi:hypothetical protein
MAEVKRITTKSSCNCSKGTTILEVNFSFSSAHLPIFLAQGYKDNKAYSATGMLYIEDASLFAIAAFGTNRLQVRCKTVGCNIDKVESILKSM